MTPFWRTFLVLGLLALGGSASLLAADDVPATKPSVAVKKLTPRFTVGKETTAVTGPLDRDGYIDYVTALNQRLARGATPTNNANVLFWKAIGPRPEGGTTMPPEFFDWLGIE